MSFYTFRLKRRIRLLFRMLRDNLLGSKALLRIIEPRNMQSGPSRIPVLPNCLWLMFLWLVFAPAQADLADTLVRVKPSVVGVGSYQVMRSPRVRLRGTGFAVGDGRHVVTNAHVAGVQLDVDAGERLAVFVGTGSRPDIRTAEVLRLNKDADLALLKIEGSPLPALDLGDSTRVREGERYAFTGFPIGAVLGLYPATHVGVIAARSPLVSPAPRAKLLDSRSIQRARARVLEVFQLDATAYPGNSGSPLFDPESGDVIGVLNMVFVKESKETILERPSGISYAIPARHVIDLLESAKKGEARQ